MALKSFDYLVFLFGNKEKMLRRDTTKYSHFLESNYKTFIDEFKEYHKNKSVHSIRDFYVVETDIGQDENWCGLPLMLFNYEFVDNMDKCPESVKLLKQIPNCNSAMFSIIAPGKRIPPHKGIYRGVYRCLLCLDVVENDKCWIKIKGEQIPFRNGKCVFFDETDIHEVCNGTDKARVVLVLDLYRRFPFPISWMNRFIYSFLRNKTFISSIPKEYQKLEKMAIRDNVHEFAPLKRA